MRSEEGFHRQTPTSFSSANARAHGDLGLTLKEANENLFRLRIKQQTERLDAPSELRRNRRLVARVKTIQSQRAKKAAAT